MSNVRQRNTVPISLPRVLAVHLNSRQPELAMPTSVEELATQAISLSAADRARLADLLLASLPDDEDPEVDAAWDQEIRRRVTAVESGAANLVSAAEVHAEARKIYKR
jgi:hypothetical protein